MSCELRQGAKSGGECSALCVQAVKALGSITSKDIGSLKALKNPPDIVKRIFDCVLLLRMYPLDKPQWQEVKGAQVRALLCANTADHANMHLKSVQPACLTCSFSLQVSATL